jgi:hypothetical protein
LTVTNLKGTRVDAMTDGVTDSVQFAERAFGGNIHPCRKGKGRRNWHEPAQDIMYFLSYWLGFHWVHYMGNEIGLQERC